MNYVSLWEAQALGKNILKVEVLPVQMLGWLGECRFVLGEKVAYASNECTF